MVAQAEVQCRVVYIPLSRGTFNLEGQHPVAEPDTYLRAERRAIDFYVLTGGSGRVFLQLDFQPVITGGSVIAIESPGGRQVEVPVVPEKLGVVVPVNGGETEIQVAVVVVVSQCLRRVGLLVADTAGAVFIERVVFPGPRFR